MKPLAPARSASYTYSSRSKVVSTSTRAAEPAARMRRVASMPSTSGIRTSINTTSGENLVAALTACSPLAASPTTVMSGSASRIIRKPVRTSDWSSAISTFTLIAATGRAACAP